MTASLTYIVQSIPWALGGLLLGVFLSRGIVAAETIADALDSLDTAAQSHDGPDRGGTMSEPDTPRRRPRRRWRVSANAVIVFLFVALALMTAVQAYVQGEASDRQTAETQRLAVSNSRLAACLKDYADDIADALDARSTASGQAQQALDEFLSAVSTATPDAQGRDLVRQALADYLAKRKAAREAQEANPFPPAPREVCQDAG